MKLTDAMRHWLGIRMTADAFLYDNILAFRRKFDLTPESAGALLAQWIKETQ